MNLYIWNFIVEVISAILILLILSLLKKKKNNKFIIACFVLLFISEIFFIISGLDKNYAWFLAYFIRVIGVLILAYDFIKLRE